MGPNTERPRRVELTRMGFVEDTGERRPTPGGADAIVWNLTREGNRVGGDLFRDLPPFVVRHRASEQQNPERIPGEQPLFDI